MNYIQFCEKHKEDSIIVYSDSILYFILIIENCDYRIVNQIDTISSYIYAFNFFFDLLAYNDGKIFLYFVPDYQYNYVYKLKEKLNCSGILFFEHRKILLCEDYNLRACELVGKGKDNICFILNQYKIPKKNFGDSISVIFSDKLRQEFYAFIIHDLFYLIDKKSYIIEIKFRINNQNFVRNDYNLKKFIL